MLWGRSGAGKSTLLSAIAGLMVPQRGTIAFGSHILFSATDRVDMAPHKRRIGYVFQDLALWPHLTALEQVRLVGRAVGLDAAAPSRCSSPWVSVRGDAAPRPALRR